MKIIEKIIPAKDRQENQRYSDEEYSGGLEIQNTLRMKIKEQKGAIIKI